MDPAATAPRVVFENPHVVAVEKPPGVLTTPSRMGKDDARGVLGRQLEAALGVRLYPVHRLDFEVGGLVLFAKTEAAHRRANAAFEGRRVEKRYWALCEGAERVGPLPASFLWESLLVRGKRRSFEAPHGKIARTQATATALIAPGAELAPPAPAALVAFDLLPETGRPHQLRVHLARAGFPIAGDELYGASTRLVVPDAIALTAVSLAFTDAEDRRVLELPIVIRLPAS